ncbi:MAG: efflux RND transporter periplasmic adaptor subunit, partial [Bacteroidetes bacterium]
VDLPVKEGDYVNRGDVLMRIKPDIYNAMKDRASAGLVSAKASLDRNESEYKRAQDLFRKGLIAESELEQAKTSFDMSKAQHDQAYAAVTQAQEDVRKTTIYSPMVGTISQLNIEQGERVLGTSQFQGTNVMTVADLSRMEARVEVGENDVVLISLGDTARIEVDAMSNRKLNGVVYEIANSATTKGLGTQEEVTNFQVKIRILDKDAGLRPGMSMTATIETETKANVLAVPIQSVTARSDMKKEAPQGGGDEEEGGEIAMNEKIKEKAQKAKEVVFYVSNDVAKQTEVKRGISDDTYVEIVNGLEEGKEIVTGSYKTISRDLEDGVKIRVENNKMKKDKDDEKQ